MAFHHLGHLLPDYYLWHSDCIPNGTCVFPSTIRLQTASLASVRNDASGLQYVNASVMVSDIVRNL